MEVEAAVRRELLNDATVNGYVSGKVFRHTLWERIENAWTPQVPTGGRAVVVTRSTGWSAPDRITTQEWPRVIIECWADADRDGTGETTADNGLDNAFALYRAVDQRLRALSIQGASIWGVYGTSPGLLVIGCQRLEEPTPFGPNNVPPDIAQSMGDLRYVTVVYGLQVVHGAIVGAGGGFQIGRGSFLGSTDVLGG